MGRVVYCCCLRFRILLIFVLLADLNLQKRINLLGGNNYLIQSGSLVLQYRLQSQGAGPFELIGTPSWVNVHQIALIA